MLTSCRGEVAFLSHEKSKLNQYPWEEEVAEFVTTVIS